MLACGPITVSSLFDTEFMSQMSYTAHFSVFFKILKGTYYDGSDNNLNAFF